MAKESKKRLTPRELMELAIAKMRSSDRNQGQMVKQVQRLELS